MSNGIAESISNNPSSNKKVKNQIVNPAKYQYLISLKGQFEISQGVHSSFSTKGGDKHVEIKRPE
jgi:hypothetical protein